MDNINGELLKHGGHAMISKLVEFFNAIWLNEKVPTEWRIGTIIKLQKKGTSATVTTGEE